MGAAVLGAGGLVPVARGGVEPAQPKPVRPSGQQRQPGEHAAVPREHDLVQLSGAEYCTPRGVVRGPPISWTSPWWSVSRNRLYAGDPRRGLTRLAAVQALMSAPMPSAPAIAVTKRKRSERGRVSKKPAESVTHELITCGAWACRKPYWIASRSCGPVLSLGHTTSVAATAAASARPPPPRAAFDHDVRVLAAQGAQDPVSSWPRARRRDRARAGAGRRDGPARSAGGSCPISGS